MSKSGRGRPPKSNNTVTVNESVVEYLSPKKDNYDHEISYFKIVDPGFRAKLKPLFSLSDEGILKLPTWATDKSEQILKVKATLVNNLHEFVNNALNIINIHFEFYHMEDLGAKEYYANITKMYLQLHHPDFKLRLKPMMNINLKIKYIVLYTVWVRI